MTSLLKSLALAFGFCVLNVFVGSVDAQTTPFALTQSGLVISRPVEPQQAVYGGGDGWGFAGYAGWAV